MIKSNRIKEKRMSSKEYSNGNKKKYFPMFINIENKKVIVVGAGHIATRRIKTLLKFECEVVVISPNLPDELKNSVTWINREYLMGDCKGALFVVTATDVRKVNHTVALDCKQYNIPVSVADKKEESTFYFPGVALEDELVVGVTASGEDHTLAKDVTHKIRALLSSVKK